MIEYRVRGKYNLWRGVWQIVDSSLPGLVIEAPKYSEFVDAINLACSEDADGREHSVMVSAGKMIWTIESVFSTNAVVNGRRQTREQAAELNARYDAA
jgi:hypothetical protein